MTNTGWLRSVVSSPPWYICKELVLVSASIRTKSINQRETALTHGIRVQMISCSWHWEKGPAGGEILSGRLLTLPLARAPPPSYQYLRFSLLNKTIVIDDTLMEAIPLTLDQIAELSVVFGFVFHLHCTELLPQNTHRRYHWYAGNVRVRRRFFAKLWKYKCYFFWSVIIILLNYPTKILLFSQDIVGLKFQNSVI